MSSGKPRRPRGLLAWHFIREDRSLGYEDGRLVEAGRTYHQPDMSRDPGLCEYGMHASKDPLHALNYAPGPVVCRVVLSNGLIYGEDKCVARSRHVLWLADASDLLHAFARSCALDVAHIWGMPLIAKQCLETGDEPIRAAAWVAARDAAWAAAWNAANAAASAAVRDAARDAAWAAAWNAARDASRAVQSKRLTETLMSLAPKEPEIADTAANCHPDPL